MGKFQIGDRVKVVSFCQSRGQYGKIMYPYHVGIHPYAMVKLDNGQEHGYNHRSLELLETNNERNECTMKKFNYVAIVNLLEDSYHKDYAFALYDTEFKDCKIDSLVVVNPVNVNKRVLARVNKICKIEDYNGKTITAQIVAVVNTSAYEHRIKEEKRLKEINEKRAAIEKEIQREIAKRKSIEYYEKIAKEYCDNPKLTELVNELKSLCNLEDSN